MNRWHPVPLLRWLILLALAISLLFFLLLLLDLLLLLHGLLGDVRVAGLVEQRQLVLEQPVGQARLVLLAQPAVLVVVHVQPDGQSARHLAAEEAADEEEERPAVLVRQPGRGEERGGDQLGADLALQDGDVDDEADEEAQA